MIENRRPDGGYVLCYGGQRIPFRVGYRKRKKLAISVYPDMQLEVTAPEGSPTERVLQRVEKRAGWILKQWRYFDRFQPTHPGSRYLSGETHVYLGRQYRLKVHQGTPETVKLVGKFLHVWADDRGDRDRIQTLVTGWYREHAERVLRHRLRVCLQQCRSLKLDEEPRITFRRMLRRWGSCMKSGSILLNPELVKVPVHCIDYVLVHEMCHLKVHNHGREFYRLLARCLPDWLARKSRLESIVL